MSAWIGVYVGPGLIVSSMTTADGPKVVSRTRPAQHSSLNAALEWTSREILRLVDDEVSGVAVVVPDSVPSAEREDLWTHFREISTGATVFLSTPGTAGLVVHADETPAASAFYDTISIEVDEGLLTAHSISVMQSGVIVNCLSYDFYDAWSRSPAGLKFMESRAALRRLRQVRQQLGQALPADTPESIDGVRYILLIDSSGALAPLRENLQEVFNSRVRLISGDDLSLQACRFSQEWDSEENPGCSEVLGLVTGLLINDQFMPLLHINEELPCQTTLIGTSVEENQHDFVFTVVQSATESRYLESLVGEFHVFNPRLIPLGDPTVELRIRITTLGFVLVYFYDPETSVPLYHEFKKPGSPPIRVCQLCEDLSLAEADFCEQCGERFPPRSEFLTDYLSEEASLQSGMPSAEETQLPMPDLEPVVDTPAPTVGSSLDEIQPAIDPQEVTSDTRQCPFCAETIKNAAIKCRHCGEFLDTSSQTLDSKHSKDPTDDSVPAETQGCPVSEPPRFNIFVSHATQDGSIAREITAALESKGVGTWLATRDIQVGDNYATQIYSAISTATHFLVLLSPASIASNHVKRELNLAVDKDITILPLVISEDTEFMTQLPADWKYWLGVVQTVPYKGADQAVAALLRRLNVDN